MKRVTFAAAILSAEGCQSGFSLRFLLRPLSLAQIQRREHFRRASPPLAVIATRSIVSTKRRHHSPGRNLAS
jgi:hypothetical protein